MLTARSTSLCVRTSTHGSTSSLSHSHGKQPHRSAAGCAHTGPAARLRAIRATEAGGLVEELVRVRRPAEAEAEELRYPIEEAENKDLDLDLVILENEKLI